MRVRIKRIYEPAAPTDGYRVLVDRLWPRGLRKEDVPVDEWCKAIAPSPELRKWFGHKPERFSEFAARYRSELATNQAVQELAAIAQTYPTITLLYAAHDPHTNHAIILQKVISEQEHKIKEKV